MITENDILMEVMHLASQALVADLSDVKRKALADIADAIAGLLPVEGEHREAETQRVAALKAALDKIELRLRTLNKTNMFSEQIDWLDATRQIAKDALGGTRSVASDEPQGMAKFLTVAPGVTLVRFAGNDEIKLMARRVGRAGNPNTLFSIEVDKHEKIAYAWRDGRLLFEVKGISVNHSMVESMAVAALHRWFKNQRKRPSKRRRNKIRKEANNG